MPVPDVRSLEEKDPLEIGEVVQFEYQAWLEQLSPNTGVEEAIDLDFGPSQVISVTYQDEADVRVTMPLFADELEDEPVFDQTQIFKIERVSGAGPKWKYLETGEGPPQTWIQGANRQKVSSAAEVAIDVLNKGKVLQRGWQN